jgi:hypothetical protein
VPPPTFALASSRHPGCVAAHTPSTIAKSTLSFSSAASVAYDCASTGSPVFCAIALPSAFTYARRCAVAPNSTDGA